MASENYIAEQIAKLNKLAQDGTSSEDLLPIIDSIRELVVKNIKMKENENDPSRLQPFGTPETQVIPSVTSSQELEPFGTPEGPSSNGIGSMQ